MSSVGGQAAPAPKVSPPASTTSSAAPPPNQLPARQSSKTARAASALKSGVVYGGSALLNSVNALVNATPHFSGAVDVVVVEQPDGSYRSTPFYVRFGKYTHLRAKDRKVNIHINGELAPFTMHLGEYGQAYFSLDAPSINADVDDDEQQSMLAGMMSPESGYSSAEEDRPQYANAQVLNSVQEEVQRLKDAGQLDNSPSGQLSSQYSGMLKGSSTSSGSPGVGSVLQPATAVDRAQQLLQRPSKSSTEMVASLSPSPPGCNGISSSPPAGLPGTGSVTSRLLSAQLDAQGSSNDLSSRVTANGSIHTPCDMSHMEYVVGFPENGISLQDEAVLSSAVSSSLQMAVGHGNADAAGGSPRHTTTSFAPDVPLGSWVVTNGHAGGDVELHTSACTDAVSTTTSPAVDMPGRSSSSSHTAHGGGPHPTSLLSLSLKANTLGSPTNSVGNPCSAKALHPSLSLTSFMAETSPVKLSDEVQGVQGSVGPTGTSVPTGDQPSLLQPALGLGASHLMQQQPNGVLLGGTTTAMETVSNGAESPGAVGPTLDAGSCSTAAALSSQQQQPQLQQSEAVPMPGRTITTRSDGLSGTSVTSEPPSGISQPGSSWQLTMPPPALSDIPRSVASSQMLAASPQILPPPPDSKGSVQEGAQQGAAGEAAARLRVASLSQANSMQGLELSLCGNLLQPGCSYSEAVQLFEAYRVGPAEWADKGVELVSCPHLVVRLQGEIYPWSAAAPLVLGWTAFGAWWPHLVPADAPKWTPPSGLTPSTSLQATTIQDAKKATGSWRLVWPFSSRRASAAPPGTDKSVSGTPPLGTSPSTSLSRALLPPPAPASTPTHPMHDPGSIATTSAPPALLTTSLSKGSKAGSEIQIDLGGPGAVSFPASAAQLSMYGKVPLSRKTLSPSWEQLKGMKLREGQNTIRYSVGTSAELVAYVYFYHWATKLVISDIDGTITKSDVLGHLLPAMGWDWSHAGISRLFTDIAANSYQLMYLSSRSISQAGITRDYLRQLVQGQHRMPEGPVIISPHGLLPSLYREMILRRPHEFKIATLQDIRALFPPDWNPFYAGFGNRDTDEISYREVGVPVGRIFIINPKGELRKASCTMQSSSLSTLASINELVHDIFPPIVRTSPSTAIHAPPPGSPSASLHDPLSGPPSSMSVLAGGGAGGKGEVGEEAAGSPPGGGTASDGLGAPARGTGTTAPPPTPARQASAHTDAASSPRKTTTTTTGGNVIPPADLLTTQAIQSQQMLLNALQAAEQYNDLNFWNSDPSALMAGDLDELEKMLVASTTPQKPVTTTSAAAAVSNSDPLSRAASVAQRGGEEVGGEEGEEEEEDEERPSRRSHDFIATYNPFAY